MHVCIQCQTTHVFGPMHLFVIKIKKQRAYVSVCIQGQTSMFGLMQLFVFDAKHIEPMCLFVFKAQQVFDLCICLYSTSKQILDLCICLYSKSKKMVWLMHLFVFKVQKMVGLCICLYSRSKTYWMYVSACIQGQRKYRAYVFVCIQIV